MLCVTSLSAIEAAESAFEVADLAANDMGAEVADAAAIAVETDALGRMKDEGYGYAVVAASVLEARKALRSSGRTLVIIYDGGACGEPLRGRNRACRRRRRTAWLFSSSQSLAEEIGHRGLEVGRGAKVDLPEPEGGGARGFR
ncbi:MAG: hypothetical protein QM757_13635 [Paludibaculum sp.]